MKKLFKTSLLFLASLGLIGCNNDTSSSVKPTSSNSSTGEVTTSKTTTSNTTTSSQTTSETVTHTLAASYTGTAKVGKMITFTGTYDGASLTKAELANATFTANPNDILTFTGNTAVCAKAGTTTVTMTYSGVSSTVSVTVVDVTKISAINSAAYYEIEGVITAMNSRSSIVSDETGSILVFGYTSGAIGEFVSVSGTTSQYNLAYQFSNDAVVTKLADQTSKPTPVAATSLTKEIADSFATYSSTNPVTNADIKPYTWTTKVGTAGDYKTLNLEGSATVIEPAYLSTDITLDVDTYYDITAYFIGYSTNHKYASVLVKSATKSVINPTAVSVSAADGLDYVYVNGTLQLTASFTPSYATETGLTWASSDTTKAIVSETGLVTGVASGSVTITATSTASGSVFGSITLNVKEANAPITCVTLNKTTLELFAEKSEQLTATVTSGELTTGFISTVKWTSSDATIATVSDDGTITAVSAGSVTITATTDGTDSSGNKLTATCALTVINKYGDATHPLDIATVKTYIDGKTATSAKTAIGPVFVKGVVESSSYSTETSNYIIWLQSDDGSTAQSFELYGVSLDSSITADFTATDALRGKTIVATGYAYKYSSTYEIAKANDVSGSILSVADTTETEVTKFSLNYSKYSLDIGKTVQLTARTYPAQAPSGTTTWTSGDVTIATVSETGSVTAIKAGTVTITATNGNKTATCEITVDPAGLSVVTTSIKATEFTSDTTDDKIATKTDGIVTYTLNKNTSTTNISLTNTDHLRVYASAKFSISISSGTLYKLEFTTTGTDYNGFTNNRTTVTNGTISSAEGTSAVVVANENVTNIDIVMGKQSRISKVVVKYIAATETTE